MIFIVLSKNPSWLDYLNKQKGNFPLIFLALLLFFFPLVLEPETREVNFTLDNGLKVLLIDRPGSPLVNLVLAVGFGSRDESPSMYGLAHLLEHTILFRGERSKPVEEIHKELKRIGAWVNGHTGFDATLFELSLPAKEMEAGVKNFVDLVFNFNLNEEDLAREKQVILEEMNLQASEPLSLALALAYEYLFPNHAYGHPLIGRPEIIKQLTLDQVIKTHRDFYSPANSALAVVGDLQASRVEELIKGYFGQIKREKKLRPVIQAPPPLEKTVRIEKEMDEQQSHLLFACRAPNISSHEQYAFDLLATIMGQGLNPLLALALGSRRISVANLYVSYNSHMYSGILLIHLMLDPKNVNLAEKEVSRWLRQLHQENFSPNDVLGEARDYVFDFLTSAKKQVQLNAEKALEDGLKLASSVALYLLLLEGTTLPPYLETIDKISSTDLRRAASKYLSRPEMAIIVIKPIKKQAK